MRRARAIVTGRVQGVSFRAATASEARRLGVVGWVRNRADGSVEALVSGTTKAVEVFVSAATRGPYGAKVKAVDLTNTKPPSEKGFHRKPTF